jgi:hypothetical protein
MIFLQLEISWSERDITLTAKAFVGSVDSWWDNTPKGKDRLKDCLVGKYDSQLRQRAQHQAAFTLCEAEQRAERGAAYDLSQRGRV